MQSRRHRWSRPSALLRTSRLSPSTRTRAGQTQYERANCWAGAEPYGVTAFQVWAKRLLSMSSFRRTTSRPKNGGWKLQSETPDRGTGEGGWLVVGDWSHRPVYPTAPCTTHPLYHLESHLDFPGLLSDWVQVDGLQGLAAVRAVPNPFAIPRWHAFEERPHACTIPKRAKKSQMQSQAEQAARTTTAAKLTTATSSSTRTTTVTKPCKVESHRGSARCSVEVPWTRAPGQSAHQYRWASLRTVPRNDERISVTLLRRRPYVTSHTDRVTRRSLLGRDSACQLWSIRIFAYRPPHDVPSRPARAGLARAEASNAGARVGR